MAIGEKGVLQVNLRWDQEIGDIGQFDDPDVRIFAPTWVKIGLRRLAKHVPTGTVLLFTDSYGNTQEKVLKGSFNLKHLIMIARNEAKNTKGVIDFELYANVTRNKKVIYAIKDLARQCIIVGKDRTTHYGGYGSKRVKHNADVILVDQVALQFQQKYNSGRLVLIGSNQPKGLLDDLIFKSVVGEKKATFSKAKMDKSGRFVKQGKVYFDTLAYEKFVEQDFLLVCLGLRFVPNIDVEKVSLKFLKYGTGFFAGPYHRILETHITRGILRGMKWYFESKFSFQIWSFDFPFYETDEDILDLCDHYLVFECLFSRNDALKTIRGSWMTATTNCANAHAMAGNTMGFGSVDAAIAQNLKSKANKFSPILNRKMKAEFILIE